MLLGISIRFNWMVIGILAENVEQQLLSAATFVDDIGRMHSSVGLGAVH